MSTLNKFVFEIKGMHCGSCEVLIERSFKKVNGVEKVNVDHATGRAEIYSAKKPEIMELNNAIKEHGYTAHYLELDNNILKKNTITIKKDHIEIGAIFIILVGIYLVLKQFDLLPKGLGISNNMSYGFIFLIGLVAAFSTCLAVTGGLLISLSAKYNEQNPDLKNYEKFRPHIYFNLGRIISYTVLGGLTGLLGSLLTISPKINGFLTIIASAIMIILGFQLLNIFPWLKRFQLKMPKFIAHKVYDASNKKQHKSAHFFFGASTYFFPCGFTQALQFYILSQGSFLVGALTMLSFSLGTLPALISLGAITSYTKGTIYKYFVKVIAVFVILLGIFSINNGFVLAGGNLDFLNFQNDNAAAEDNIKLTDGKQIINMKVVGLDYAPDKFNILAGVPVEWRIDGSDAQGCAQIISVPSLGITKRLLRDEINIIRFTPKKEGTIRFSCGMGMAGPGTFNVRAK